jgi:hypothetical protein
MCHWAIKSVWLSTKGFIQNADNIHSAPLSSGRCGNLPEIMARQMKFLGGMQWCGFIDIDFKLIKN